MIGIGKWQVPNGLIAEAVKALDSDPALKSQVEQLRDPAHAWSKNELKDLIFNLNLAAFSTSVKEGFLGIPANQENELLDDTTDPIEISSLCVLAAALSGVKLSMSEHDRLSCET